MSEKSPRPTEATLGPYDTLLEWASEMGAGEWLQWRRACKKLDLEPSLAAHNMAVLGHMEFDWHRHRFAVVPSCAVFVSGTSGCLPLVGSRPRGFLDSIRSYWEPKDRRVHFWIVQPKRSQEGPLGIWLEVDVTDIERLCADLSLEICVHPGKCMLERLPDATLENVGEHGYPDTKFTRDWLEPKRLAIASPPSDGSGLWSVHEYRRREAYVRRGGMWRRIPEREYGPYVAYPQESYIRYREGAQELLVADCAPLPTLVARTASLRTGFLPVPDTETRGWHVYHNIDLELCDLIIKHLSAKVTLT